MIDEPLSPQEWVGGPPPAGFGKKKGKISAKIKMKNIFFNRKNPKPVGSTPPLGMRVGKQFGFKWTPLGQREVDPP